MATKAYDFARLRSTAWLRSIAAEATAWTQCRSLPPAGRPGVAAPTLSRVRFGCNHSGFHGGPRFISQHLTQLSHLIMTLFCVARQLLYYADVALARSAERCRYNIIAYLPSSQVPDITLQSVPGIMQRFWATTSTSFVLVASLLFCSFSTLLLQARAQDPQTCAAYSLTGTSSATIGYQLCPVVLAAGYTYTFSTCATSGTVRNCDC